MSGSNNCLANLQVHEGLVNSVGMWGGGGGGGGSGGLTISLKSHFWLLLVHEQKLWIHLSRHISDFYINTNLFFARTLIEVNVTCNKIRA